MPPVKQQNGILSSALPASFHIPPATPPSFLRCLAMLCRAVPCLARDSGLAWELGLASPQCLIALLNASPSLLRSRPRPRPGLQKGRVKHFHLLPFDPIRLPNPHNVTYDNLRIPGLAWAGPGRSHRTAPHRFPYYFPFRSGRKMLQFLVSPSCEFEILVRLLLDTPREAFLFSG
jgi:hypothetical protein